MPLSKRKQNGEFELWTSASSSAAGPSGSSSRMADAAPPEVRNLISTKTHEEHQVTNVSHEDEPPAKRTRTRTGAINRTSTTITTATTTTTTAPAKRGRPRKTITTAATTASKGKGKAKAIADSLPVVAFSSSSAAGPSTTAAEPPAKRGRKKAKDAGTSQPEKRLALFKSHCPQNIMDRVHRVMTQRIFMISRHREAGELKETFQVLGSTGNVYTVTIDHKPRCDCPDAYKGNHCKHILFVFLKVLQVSQDKGHWYQKALLTSELEEVFADAPPAPNSLAHPKIREAYARATGQAPAAEEDAQPESGNRKIPGEDDDCPICYDGMHGAKEDKLVWCEECGNALHKECFGQWERTSKAQGKSLTCVWCRAPWITIKDSASTPKKTGCYLNFAGVAGVSPVRDTSTYYHGPRAGHRYYGYRDYDD